MLREIHLVGCSYLDIIDFLKANTNYFSDDSVLALEHHLREKYVASETIFVQPFHNR
jgi:hypothetical protein